MWEWTEAKSAKQNVCFSDFMMELKRIRCTTKLIDNYTAWKACPDHMTQLKKKWSYKIYVWPCEACMDDSGVQNGVTLPPAAECRNKTTVMLLCFLVCPLFFAKMHHLWPFLRGFPLSVSQVSPSIYFWFNLVCLMFSLSYTMTPVVRDTAMTLLQIIIATPKTEALGRVPLLKVFSWTYVMMERAPA